MCSLFDVHFGRRSGRLLQRPPPSDVRVPAVKHASRQGRILYVSVITMSIPRCRWLTPTVGTEEALPGCPEPGVYGKARLPLFCTGIPPCWACLPRGNSNPLQRARVRARASLPCSPARPTRRPGRF